MPYARILRKFCGHNVSMRSNHNNYVDFTSILAQNPLDRRNLPYFPNGAWERELINYMHNWV